MDLNHQVNAPSLGHRNSLRFCLMGLILPFFLGLSACSEMQVIEQPVQEPESRVFKGDFEQVWRAVQLAMRKYPVRVNNIDAGLLETEYVKGERFFVQPGENHGKPGLRYKLTIRAVKGKLEKSSAIKITMTKTAEIQTDFFTGFHPLPVNGLEEKALLYRIGRYIEIDELMTKAVKNPDPKKK